ncbi:oxidoreductase [Nakamurella sp. PAMC28650]|uniref:oxidoreductase n=1 Tax=Nakamurella sp. PAMC28650 TaxID=2762325 RepID=UPI00164DCFEB|nr:oxidoreductase [Nakamurella sp. PAMC28650]QNK81164.1 oxidoreductase [Nakamurella sp. PAMC28650]
MSASSPAAAAGTFSFGGDLTVNRLGYGAMRLSGPGIMGPPKDRDEAIAVLREAVALGVNHIDTSDYYGPYLVNELIKEALYPYPEDLVLVTKVGARRTARGGWPAALSAQELTDAVHDNLKRLGIEQIHAVNLRMADARGGVMRENSLAEPFETMAWLQQQGLIRHLGVSNVGREAIIEAQSIAPIACVQNQFNLVQRDDEEIVDLCAAEGIAFVPFFPLGGFSPLAADRFAAVATEIGATTMQLALAWLLQRSPAILCIPGTSSVAHLRENIAAGEISLSPDQLDELDRLAR